MEGTIGGRELLDYALEGDPSQRLSVDLESADSSVNFNISANGAADVLFTGAVEGRVADVRLSDADGYTVRVYLSGPAADRGDVADFSLAIGLGPPEFADGLSGGPDYWEVSVGGGSLNLRAGPHTRYERIGTLRDGERLRNQGCRLTGSERWCAVRAARSGVSGWVAGRYLLEAAAPRAPAMPPGGPTGNGLRFDATGNVGCTTDANRTATRCPFGVLREGPGNAGVWIALPDGEERHILFENGTPVATNSPGVPVFDKVDDLFLVTVGEERYEIPEAVVNGG